MKTDLFGLVLLIASLWVGDYVGPMIGGMFGGTTGYLAMIVTAIVCYLIYSLLTGSKMSLWGAILFIIGVYVANIIIPMIAGFTGFVLSGILIYVAEALILSLLLGFIAPKEPMPVKA